MSFQPTSHGYDVTAGLRPAPGGWNGTLSSSATKGDERVLWVYEVQTGFGMAGSTGQSPQTRSFFPHNMEQQQFTILCQFPNQKLYADCIEFIRREQRSLASRMKLMVLNRGIPSRRLKGVHHNLSVEGYISSVTREHRQFVKAPELRFDFITEAIHEPGVWKGTSERIDMMQTWRDLIEKRLGDGAILPPLDPPPNEGEVRPPRGIGPNGESRPG